MHLADLVFVGGSINYSRASVNVKKIVVASFDVELHRKFKWALVIIDV